MLGVKLPASFYDHSNAEAVAKRKEACDQALTDLVEYMKQDGVRLGIYDATNSDPKARAQVSKRLNDEHLGVKKIFIEVICDDESQLKENFHSVQTSLPDYEGEDPEEALKDFIERRKKYMDIYKEVEDSEGSYFKILNYHKFVMHNIRGYLPLKVRYLQCDPIFTKKCGIFIFVFFFISFLFHKMGQTHLNFLMMKLTTFFSKFTRAQK